MGVRDEVTAADIARIAGVGRAAVSNWRRRHPDFPAPIGGPVTSPTFAWPEVKAWLKANGRLDPADPDPLPGPRASASGFASAARSMAALLPRIGQGTVFDPACGDGMVLRSAAERLGRGLRYAGQDEDQALLEAARQALAEAGATDVVLQASDAQRAALRGDADLVISIAPITGRVADGFPFEYGQPARADHPLGWVQLCLSCLRPGGTAVVAVPFAVSVRASARRIRAELLRAGVLTQVVGLPDRAVGAGTGPWQIWTLTNPVGRPAHLLRLVDLGDRDQDRLPQSEDDWADVLADPHRTRELPSIELLDEDVLLVPAAHIDPQITDVTADYAGLGDQYREAVGRLADTAPRFDRTDRPALGALLTVAELARSGALAFVDRHLVEAGDVIVPPGSGQFAAYVADDGIAEVGATGQVLRCDAQYLDPYFLACFLRSELNRRQAAGTSGGTFRLDVRRARVPRLPLSEQRRYRQAFVDLMALSTAADEAARTARDVTRTAIYGLTSGIFAPPGSESELLT